MFTRFERDASRPENTSIDLVFSNSANEAVASIPPVFGWDVVMRS
jgi:hypothetical protein